MGVSLFGGKKGGPTVEKKCLLSLSPSSLSPVITPPLSLFLSNHHLFTHFHNIQHNYI